MASPSSSWRKESLCTKNQGDTSTRSLRASRHRVSLSSHRCKIQSLNMLGNSPHWWIRLLSLHPLITQPRMCLCKERSWPNSHHFSLISKTWELDNFWLGKSSKGINSTALKLSFQRILQFSLSGKLKLALFTQVWWVFPLHQYIITERKRSWISKLSCKLMVWPIMKLDSPRLLRKSSSPGSLWLATTCS